MGWTALTVAVLIALNEGLAWAGWLNYVWAALVALWAIAELK